VTLPRSPAFNFAWAVALGCGATCMIRDARAADEVGSDLAAAARAGARPEECGGASRVHAGRWERAKIPALGRYCDLLARGYASLSTAPDVSARNAEAAENALPGLPAPLVLRARAELRRGALAEAFSRFERARALSAKSLDAPATLHDYAICSLGSGHPAEALAAYRALVPRADLLGDRWEELAVFVEAAALATSVSKDSLAEAIGYVTEARRRGIIPGIGDAVLSALALALDRAGRSAEAASVTREAAGASWLEVERALQASGKPSRLPALPPNEIDAMIAIIAERDNHELALDRWQSYLASPAGKTGPFAAHARAHRDALAHGKAAP
jgi:hypothetical protein